MSLTDFPAAQKRSRLLMWTGALVFVALIVVGVFARNQWFPSSDAWGNRTGWFGNPLARPLPTPTPQLAREYVYASGSRRLSVIDSNAQEVPPADLAIWRPSTGGWWVLGGVQGSQQITQTWGTSGDDPVEGDYDGDGKTDFSVFRPGNNTWYIMYSSTATTAQFQFGASSDVPAQSDFDGDGKTDAALFRPSTGTWYVIQSGNGQTLIQTFGNSTDTPYPADHDGDGRADLAVWRPSNQTFYSFNSSNGVVWTMAHGQSGTPVSADYDGDGKADYAVYNSSNANWHIRQSTTGTLLSPIQWGNANDKPVQNDYDGDAKVDLAVWRNSNGNWYIRQSASGNALRQVQWGSPGDIPVPAFYRR